MAGKVESSPRGILHGFKVARITIKRALLRSTKIRHVLNKTVMAGLDPTIHHPRTMPCED
jgi:hypothetical protein